MAKIKMTINDLYNYICEHNTISDVVDMIDLKEDGYKRLRRALNWNNIPVIPPQEKKVQGWDEQEAIFRSQRIFDTFMEIWNPSEEYKNHSIKELE
jgi:hypothetical protein